MFFVSFKVQLLKKKKKFSSFFSLPPSFLQMCFQIVVPGRVDISLFYLYSLIYLFFIFLSLVLFLLNSTLLCFPSPFSSCIVISPQPTDAAAIFFLSLPREPSSPSSSCLCLSSPPIYLFGAVTELIFWMSFLHCSASLVSRVSWFSCCD